MGVIMIEICFSSSLPSWPNERLLGPEVVDHNHLGSAEVNENKIKHKWSICAHIMDCALFFHFSSISASILTPWC
jgi:hypothetical protein